MQYLRKPITRATGFIASQPIGIFNPNVFVRSYTPISTLSRNITRRDSSASTHTSLHPTFIVRNAAASHGRLLLQLPFPGSPGLSTFQMNDEASTVQELIESVHKMDPSLKAVEITTTNGKKIARSMHLRELIGMDFILRLNNTSITVENEGTKGGAQQPNESVGFARVKATIEKDSRPYLPLEEFYKICLNAGAEEAVANKWLRELQRRKLVVNFDRSTNSELQQAIILRPDGTESSLMLQNALDSELYNIKHARKIQEQHLQELTMDWKKAVLMETETQKLARQFPNTGKWLVFTGISSFYGTLMYLVWDVYSWDVMEPITYFIGFTGILANSMYHSMTKRDATYTNIWHKQYQKRWAVICEERRYNPLKTKELEQRVQTIQQDVELLIELEGKKERNV